MKNLVKSLIPLLMIISLSGCAMVNPLREIASDVVGTSCKIIIGGSSLEGACVLAEDAINPEDEAAEDDI